MNQTYEKKKIVLGNVRYGKYKINICGEKVIALMLGFTKFYWSRANGTDEIGYLYVSMSEPKREYLVLCQRNMSFVT